MFLPKIEQVGPHETLTAREGEKIHAQFLGFVYHPVQHLEGKVVFLRIGRGVASLAMQVAAHGGAYDQKIRDVYAEFLLFSVPDGSPEHNKIDHKIDYGFFATILIEVGEKTPEHTYKRMVFPGVLCHNRKTFLVILRRRKPGHVFKKRGELLFIVLFGHAHNLVQEHS